MLKFQYLSDTSMDNFESNYEWTRMDVKNLPACLCEYGVFFRLICLIN